MKRVWILGVMAAVGLGSQVAGALREMATQQRGIAAPAIQPQAATQQEGTFVVTGIVRNLLTKVPLAAINLSIFPATGARGFSAQPAVVASVISDSDGRFTFSKLSAGNYTIRAEREGYFGVSNQQLQQGAVNATVTLSPQQTASNVVLELIPGASVRGRVFDSSGRPLSGVQVNALLATYPDGHTVLSSNRNATTDDRGEFRIWGLSPGRYYLRAQARPSASTNGLSPIVYYPDERDPGRATAVALQSDMEFVADVRLSAAEMPLKVSGRVSGLDSVNATAVSYYLIRRDTQVWDNADLSAASNRTPGRGRGSDMTFELQAQSPGRYEVVAVAQIRGTVSQASTTLIGKGPIDVVDRNIDGVTISLRPSFELTVRIVNGDAQTVGALAVFPRDLLPISMRPSRRATGGNNGTQSATENEFKFSGVTEGRYFLDSPLTGLREAYVADIRQGTRSIYEDGAITIGQESPEVVEVVLARPAGTISGVVQDATNKPVSSAQVVLVPEGRRRENPLFYKTAIAAADGQFTLSGLAPGQYKIFAWEKAWESGWQSLPRDAERNPRFMASVEQFGRAVNIGAGSGLSNVTLAVIRDRP